MSVSHHIGARNQTPNPGPQQEQAFLMDKPLTVRYDKMREKKNHVSSLVFIVKISEQY